uniref:PtpRR6 n=1 Tax=Arundo donax TaxID=35708 RepID=A0A0A9CXU7_ARUDO
MHLFGYSLHVASIHVAISYATHSFSLVSQGSPPHPSACT